MGQLLRWERDESAVRHMNDLDLEIPESRSLIGCKITMSATRISVLKLAQSFFITV